MEVNDEEGKTEAIIEYNGKGAEAERKALHSPTNTATSHISTEASMHRPLAIKVVTTYKHLGTNNSGVTNYESSV